jgi:uncharacterized protein (TIGR00251 family)
MCYSVDRHTVSGMPSDINVTAHPDGARLEVWVVPGAARTEMVGPHNGALRIRVAAPPEDGRANRAVLAFLKKALGAPAVHLEKGNRSRRKSVVVAGLAPDAASRRLADLLEH